MFLNIFVTQRSRPALLMAAMLPALALLTALAAPVAVAATAPEVLAADDVCPSPARPEDPSCSLSALQAGSRQHRPQASAPRSLAEAAEGLAAAAVASASAFGGAALAGGAAASAASRAGATGVSLGQQHQKNKRRRGIKIIDAGLPKTGTSSIKVALDRLGYHSVHGEFLELSMFSGMWHTWQYKNNPWPAIDKMLDMGYDAVGDRPWCWVYKELLGLYPDAKVILSHYPRGASAWATALDNWTLAARDNHARPDQKVMNVSYGQSFSASMFAKMHNCYIGESIAPGGAHFSADMVNRCREGYDRWTEEVKAFVPPSQLLEYNVTQGWEPLCKFLEIEDCPTEEPFPNVDARLMAVGEGMVTLGKLLMQDNGPPALPLTGLPGFR